MRKIQKQELIELIDTLKEASEQLKRCDGQQREAFCGEIQEFVEGIYEYALGVLCQEAKLVTLLEKIYETLFQVAKGEATPAQFSKEVQQVEIEACNLKVDQIEVAFFCYKASMADSLESVYLAAKADPQCEAFFVPIPYFDRDAEDVFGEMHLEGQGCYSDKFELTDWQQYDVQHWHIPAVYSLVLGGPGLCPGRHRRPVFAPLGAAPWRQSEIGSQQKAAGAFVPCRCGNGRKLDLAFRGLQLYHRGGGHLVLLYAAYHIDLVVAGPVPGKADRTADSVLCHVHGRAGSHHRHRRHGERKGSHRHSVRAGRSGFVCIGGAAQQSHACC